MKSYLIAILTLILLASCESKNIDSTQSSAPTISEVRDLGRMEFAEMTVTKMGTIEDLKMKDASSLNEKAAAIFNALKIGTRKGAWSYDTYLRAFVDLSQISDEDINVDTIAHTASVTLPRIETEIAGRDINLREEHYRVTGLRSNISASERAALKEKMNTMLKNEIANNREFERELRSRAEQRARIWIDSLYSSRGYSVNVYFK